MRENFFLRPLVREKKTLLFYSYAGEIYHYEGDKTLTEQNVIIFRDDLKKERKKVLHPE